MHVFPHSDVSFSLQCQQCGRWVWCGRKEHEAKCACGQRYEVLFDASTPDWSKPRGWVCACCGTKWRMLEAPSVHNPWHLLNEWQLCCEKCFSKQSAQHRV